jgi:hypothetical protein
MKTEIEWGIPTYMDGTLSTVVLVKRVLRCDLTTGCEYHVDCLAMDSLGNVCELEFMEFADTVDDAAVVSGKIAEGSIMQISGVLSYAGGRITLYSPAYRSINTEEAEFRQRFESFLMEKQKHDTATFTFRTESDGAVSFTGNLYDCRIVVTKHSGPMAFLKVAVGEGDKEVIVFPDTYKRTSKDLLATLGVMKFSGRYQEAESETGLILVAEEISPA